MYKEMHFRAITKKIEFLKKQIEHNKNSEKYTFETFQQLKQIPQTGKRKEDDKEIDNTKTSATINEEVPHEKRFRLPLVVLKIESAPQYIPEKNGYKVKILNHYHDFNLNPIN